MIRVTNKNELSAQYLLRAKTIFETNGWEVKRDDENSESMFNRFCDRLKDLRINERRNLFLELTERYLWISEDKYADYLIDVLLKLVNESPQMKKVKKIYVLALLSPDDYGKIKSSMSLVYLFNTVKIRYTAELKEYKFEIINDVADIIEELNNEDAILLMADDYIGTGETAEEALIPVLNQGIKEEVIYILSLAAQKDGIDYISKRYSVNVVVGIIRNKGISDYYIGKELEKKREIMEKTEEVLGVKKEFRFGYRSSEALVTMCRTPNNTFPVFWEESQSMNKAPFPRF